MKHRSKITVLILFIFLTLSLVISSAYAQDDSDGDGMTDDVDACPFENGEGNRNEFGCIDDDQDGVEDWFDKCPNSVDLANRPVGLDGCWDQDGDGLTGDDDLCSNGFGPANTFGCPDTDGDGFAYDPNYVNQISNRDNCPDVPGPINGCPDPNAQPSATPTMMPTNTPVPDTNQNNTDTNTDTTTNNPPSATNTTDTTTTTTTTTTNNPPTSSSASTSENCSTGRYLTTRLEIDGLGTVINDNSPGNLNFRAGPSTGAGVISVIRDDEFFAILAGPRCGQNPNLVWWNVYFEGRSGWIAESDGAEYLAKPVEISDEATVLIEDMVLTTVDVSETAPDGSAYIYEQNPLIDLECGTTVKIIFSVQNQYQYTYADILNDATNLLTVLDNTTNDDNDTNDIRLEEFVVTESGLYSLFGQSDIEGKFFAIIEPPTSITAGRGGQTTNATTNCDDEQVIVPATTGRGGQTTATTSEQSTNPNVAAQAAAAAANNTRTCNNVATGIVAGTPFGNPSDGFILDGNANTGWSTSSLANTFFGVSLNGTQTISSIELNGDSWTNTPANSVRGFEVTYFVDDEENPFITIFSGEAPLQAGVTEYSFAENTLATVWIFINSNHGGTNFELTDIRVCAS